MTMGGRQRSAAEQQVADLLRTAKSSLNLSVAFLSRLDGTTQHLEVVESSVPFLFKEGVTQKQETTFCQAILDGRLPAVIPDVTKFPAAMKLPAARLPRIRSYVSVPVVLSDGSLYGTFCAAGLTSRPWAASRSTGTRPPTSASVRSTASASGTSSSCWPCSAPRSTSPRSTATCR
jgi:GAF domain-containing protein